MNPDIHEKMSQFRARLFGIYRRSETRPGEAEHDDQRLQAEIDGYLEQVIAAEEKLSHQNRELEARVQQRTRELEETNRRSRAILESITDASFCVDEEWRLVDISPAVEQFLFHRPADGLIGKGLWLEYPQFAASDFEYSLRRALESGQAVHGEGRIDPQGGWFEYHAFPHAGRMEVYLRDINVRRQREEHLAHQAQILENIHDAVVAIDMDHRITFWNHAAERFYGWSAAEVLGKNVYALIPSIQSLPERLAMLEQVDQDGRFEHVTTHFTRDNHPLIVDGALLALYDERGEQTGYVCTSHDITAWRNAEISLETEREQVDRLVGETQRQKELLSRLIEATPAGIMLISGADYQVRYANQVQRDLFRPYGDPIGEPIREVAGGRFDAYLQLIEQINQSGESTRLVDILLPAAPHGGEPRYLTITAFPLKTTPGLAAGILVFTEDATAAVQARQQIEAERARLEAILENAPEGILVTDAHTRILFSNRYIEQILGQPVANGGDYHTLAGLRLRKADGVLYDPRDLPLTRSALDGETHREVEMQIEWPDGQLHHLLVNSAPIRDSGAVGLFQDITERKRTESNDRFIANLNNLFLNHADISALIEALVGDIAAHLAVQRCLFLEFDLEAQNVVIHPDFSSSGQWLAGEYSLDFMPIEKLEEIRKGCPLILTDTSQNLPSADPFTEIYRDCQIGALMLIPMHRDKKTISILLAASSAPRHWKDGEVIFLEMVAERVWAVIENRRLVRALQDSDERFRLASRAVSGIVYDWDLVTGQILRSEGLEEALGYTPEEAPGGQDWWGSLVHPDDIHLLAEMLPAIQKGSMDAYDFEYRVRHKAGHWVDLWDRAFVIRRPDGTAVRVVGTSSVISERKRMEQALRDASERFHLALSNSPIWVYTTDRDLRYSWVYNPPFNLSVGDLLGKRDAYIFGEENAAELDALKRRVLASGKMLVSENCLNFHGEEWYFNNTIDPLLGEDGEILGVAVAAMNVSAQRRAEAQAVQNLARVEVQRRLIQQREMERQQIARDIHDGPLQELYGLIFAIKAAKDLCPAAEQPGDNPPAGGSGGLNEIREILETMDSGALGLVAELRAICSNLRPPILGHFGLDKAILSHMDGFKATYPHLHVDLELENDNHLLPEPTRLALYRIYQEAINNVVRHANARRVYIALYFHDDWVHLEIADNGRGFQIPDRWVDLARQGHLGLAGIQERAESIGGKVWLDSFPGEGVRIRVAAPLNGLADAL